MEELTSKLVAPEIELISKQLSSLDKEASKLEKVILISTGSFNPVHKMHIELFSLSIEELEKKRSKVVACILAPASDEYVLIFKH